MHLSALTIILLVIIAVALITFVDLHFERRGVRVGLRRLRQRFKEIDPPAHGIAVLILPTSGQNIWLQASGDDHRPAMSISGHWQVMNMTDEPVRFARAFIVRLPANGGDVLVRCPPGLSFRDQPIDPGSASEAITHFWVHPAVRSPGDDFTATVVFVDQFANEHAVENVTFRWWSG